MLLKWQFLSGAPLLLLRKIQDLPLVLLSTVNVLMEALSKGSKLLIKGAKYCYHVVGISGQLQIIVSPFELACFINYEVNTAPSSPPCHKYQLTHPLPQVYTSSLSQRCLKIAF